MKEHTNDRYKRMQADRDAGMPKEKIAEKYGISVNSVAVYTRAPKNNPHNSGSPRPRAERTSPSSPSNPAPRKKTASMNFDDLLADLEQKKQEIEKAIEAVKVVQRLYEKGDDE